MNKYVIKDKVVNCYDALEDSDEGSINIKLPSIYDNQCNAISKLSLSLKFQYHMLNTLYLRIEERDQDCPEFMFEFEQVIKNLQLFKGSINDNNYNGAEQEVSKQLIASLEKLNIAAKNTQDINQWFVELKYSPAVLGMIAIIPTIGCLLYSTIKTTLSTEFVAASFISGVAVAGLVRSSEKLFGYSGEPTQIIQASIDSFNEIDTLFGKIYQLPHD